MLDNYTPSQQRAKGTFASGRNILLTGNPGAGKTAVLEDICEESRANGKRVLTTGSTGMAAANLEGGRTIHSVLGWFPRGTNFNIEVCARAMAECDLLILDEISMLGKDILDHFMKCYKSLPDKPQLIFSGDFFQLPPVRDDYPFEHAQWNDLALTPCFLKEVVRQQDPVFKAMLERAMLGDPSELAADYKDGMTFPTIMKKKEQKAAKPAVKEPTSATIAFVVLITIFVAIPAWVTLLGIILGIVLCELGVAAGAVALLLTCWTYGPFLTSGLLFGLTLLFFGIFGYAVSYFSIKYFIVATKWYIDSMKKVWKNGI